MPPSCFSVTANTVGTISRASTRVGKSAAISPAPAAHAIRPIAPEEVLNRLPSDRVWRWQLLHEGRGFLLCIPYASRASYEQHLCGVFRFPSARDFRHHFHKKQHIMSMVFLLGSRARDIVGKRYSSQVTISLSQSWSWSTRSLGCDAINLNPRKASHLHSSCVSSMTKK